MPSESQQSISLSQNRFVFDGHARARSALEPQIRVEVTALYAEWLAKASVIGRFWLEREMEREIQRRLHERAPQDALY